MTKYLRANTDNQVEYSPTRKLINQMELLATQSRTTKHQSLYHERKHKSMQFQKKRLHELTSIDFDRSFKPPSTHLSLFDQLTPLNCGQEYIPPIKNVERTSNSRFRSRKRRIIQSEWGHLTHNSSRRECHWKPIGICLI